VSERGYWNLQGLAPSGEGESEFRISQAHLAHFEENGPAYKYYEAFSIDETIKSPLIIAEGLRREGYEEGLCYIGKPKKHGKDWSGPGPPKMVFLVCMSKDFKIFEWRWEKEDMARPNYPDKLTERFTKIKWKHSSIT
jgi:hypothetical protein